MVPIKIWEICGSWILEMREKLWIALPPLFSITCSISFSYFIYFRGVIMVSSLSTMGSSSELVLDTRIVDASLTIFWTHYPWLQNNPLTPVKNYSKIWNPSYWKMFSSIFMMFWLRINLAIKLKSSDSVTRVLSLRLVRHGWNSFLLKLLERVMFFNSNFFILTTSWPSYAKTKISFWYFKVTHSILLLAIGRKKPL